MAVYISGFRVYPFDIFSSYVANFTRHMLEKTNSRGKQIVAVALRSSERNLYTTRWRERQTGKLLRACVTYAHVRKSQKACINKLISMNYD